MATVLQLPKRKKNVYGKSSRSGFTAANYDSFFEDDELVTAEPTVGRQLKVKSTYKVQKTEAKQPAPKSKKPLAKAQDTFDVPSSDEEVVLSSKTVPQPRYRPTLYDDTNTSTARAGPFGKKSTENSDGASRARVAQNKTPEANPSTPLKRDLERPTVSSGVKNKINVASQSSHDAVGKQVMSPETSPSQTVDATSAVARLAARKRLVDGGSTFGLNADVAKPTRTLLKRSAIASVDLEGTPRKRVRLNAGTAGRNEDVIMTDAFAAPVCKVVQDMAEAKTVSDNIFDFPDSSADESRTVKRSMTKLKVTEQSTRRGKLTTYSRLTPRKGVSAPERLIAMIPTTAEFSEPTSCSPAKSMSRQVTPQQPSTPPSARASSPGMAFRGTMTPKQANMWNNLLPSDPAAASPSALPIEDLSIHGTRRTAAQGGSRKLLRSQSDVPARRTRLVDRLKASALNSDDESSEDDHEAEILEVPEPKANSAINNADDVQTVSKQTSQSQSQSQTTSAVGSGPKITYSRVRSYLPEDSLEDDLMFGLPSATPHRSTTTARGVAKAAGPSQKSAFDLSESEEDEPGKMRSIHELRASGSNARGIGDIEDLLDETGKHNISQRSSRRAALISLGSNLMNKWFRDRFIGHSCESRLAAECGATADDIGDFLLASVVTLLLSSDPPEHVIRSLQDHGVAAWLPKLLMQSTEVSKLAKERRNNMSKVSQSSLVEFADKLKNQQALWGEDIQIPVNTRLIALKALDQLVRSLRRLGDTTGLLNADQVAEVLSQPTQSIHQGKQLELTLSISVLESLSTTSLSLDWPPNTLKSVGELLPQLDALSPGLRHTRFLALRLCLNLTRDNTRNCTLLAESGDALMVSSLLRAIKSGFDHLGADETAESRSVSLDLLVLAIGIMINLAEHCDGARKQAGLDQDLLAALIETCLHGQKQMLEAESVEESVSNVTYGYLAVMLANLCQNASIRAFIASKLPGQNLAMLIGTVGEFVSHHQKVDTMVFEGEEGTEVWSAFTEKLKAVLARLEAVE